MTMPMHLQLGDRRLCSGMQHVFLHPSSTSRPTASSSCSSSLLSSNVYRHGHTDAPAHTHAPAHIHAWDRPEWLPQNPSDSESAAPHHPCLPSQRSPLLQPPSPRVIIFHSHTLSKPLALSHLLNRSMRHRQHHTRQCRRKSQCLQPGGRRGGRDTENECGDTKGCVSEAIRRCFVLGSRRSCHSSRVGGGR